MPFVHARGVQAYGLVVGDVAVAFAIFGKELRVERPGYDRGGDEVVGAVDVGALGEIEELPTTGREARFVQIGALCLCEGEEAGVDKGDNELAFKILNVGEGLRA